MQVNTVRLEVARKRNTVLACPNVLDEDESAITPVYSVVVRTVAGKIVATFDNWKRLTIRRVLNAPDVVTFSIWGGDERADFFPATTS